MNIKEEFWSTKYGGCSELNDDMVYQSETRLGVKLPQKLIELLKIQNGGYTQGFGYKMSEPTSWANHHVPFNELFGLDPKQSNPAGFNILDTDYMVKEWGLPKGLVLISGDGHWFIALDYRKGSEPSVRWFDSECNQDIHIANSFDEFITNLISPEEIEELEG